VRSAKLPIIELGAKNSFSLISLSHLLILFSQHPCSRSSCRSFLLVGYLFFGNILMMFSSFSENLLLVSTQIRVGMCLPLFLNICRLYISLALSPCLLTCLLNYSILLTCWDLRFVKVLLYTLNKMD